MKILYLEPFSGVSGDMLLGLLVDLGVPLAHLQDQVDGLVDITATLAGVRWLRAGYV